MKLFSFAAQMASFQTKNPNFGKFGRVLHRLETVDITYYFLWTFGIFYDHLVHFFGFWYHVPRKIWQPWPSFTLHTYPHTPYIHNTTPF
jgi:hypothetical protein